MTNDVHTPTPPVQQPVPATTVPLVAPPLPDRRRRTARHVVAIVAGCLMLVPGLGLLAGGGTLAIAQAVGTDDDGYFRFGLDRVDTPASAIATTDLWDQQADDEDWPWALDFVDLDVRLRVDGAADTDRVFVGIARSADVERYLSNVAHAEVTDIRDHAPVYRQVAGADRAPAPTEQDFWVASSSGPDEQELTWHARGGRWSVVVMNADGSPSVAADVEVGVRSGAVTPIAVALLVLGGLTATMSTLLIVLGVRGRRAPGRQLVGPAPLAPPAPATPVTSDDVPVA